MGGYSEQRETPVPGRLGKLEAPSKNDSTQPIQGLRKAGAAYGDKSHHFRDPLRWKENFMLFPGEFLAVVHCITVRTQVKRVKRHSWLQGAFGLFPGAPVKSRGYTEYPSQMCKPTCFIPGSTNPLQGCILSQHFVMCLQRPCQASPGGMEGIRRKCTDGAAAQLQGITGTASTGVGRSLSYRE